MLIDDPLDADRLRAELVWPGGLWRRVEVVAETGSTNADLAARARLGEPAGSVLIADYQRAGRGRQGRIWTAPPGTGIAMSVLLRPTRAAARWTWLPLLAGVGVADGLRRSAGLDAVLKWPNDVLVDDRKICGILTERVETAAGPAVVIGVGVNVHLGGEQLPVPTATSVALARADRSPPRNELIATILAACEMIFARWLGSDDDAGLAAAYLERCDTIGRRVRLELTGGQVVEGVAEGVDGDGRLVVATAAGRGVYGSGDVVHVR